MTAAAFAAARTANAARVLPAVAIQKHALSSLQVQACLNRSMFSPVIAQTQPTTTACALRRGASGKGGAS